VHCRHTSRELARDVDKDGGHTGTLLPRQSQVSTAHVASPVAVAGGRDLLAKGVQVRAPCGAWRRWTIVRPESAQADHRQCFAALTSQPRQLRHTYTPDHIIIIVVISSSIIIIFIIEYHLRRRGNSFGGCISTCSHNRLNSLKS